MKRVLSICFLVSLAFFWANRSDADEDCLTCHPVFNDLKVRHAALDMGCGSCHDKPHAKEKAVLSLTAEVPDLCYSCHDKALFAKKNQHAPVAGGMCLSCHNPHGGTEPKLLVSQAPDLCYSCHDKALFAKKNQHTPVAGGMCLSCHNPHASAEPKLLVSQVPELCYSCHDKGAFSKKTVHPPVKDGQCSFCHLPHASDEPFNLTQPVFSLCTTCHDKQTSGRHVTRSLDPLGNHPVKSKADPARSGRELTCTSCHTPHASGSKRLFVNDAASVESLCLHCHRKITVVR